jgi:hypothetical protein
MLLLAFITLAAGSCPKTSYYNQTYIEVSGVRCFTIVMPDQSTVAASDFTVNGDGTYTIGNRTVTIDARCEANPVTTTTGHTTERTRSGPPGL